MTTETQLLVTDAVIHVNRNRDISAWEFHHTVGQLLTILVETETQTQEKNATTKTQSEVMAAQPLAKYSQDILALPIRSADPQFALLNFLHQG